MKCPQTETESKKPKRSVFDLKLEDIMKALNETVKATRSKKGDTTPIPEKKKVQEEVES